MRHGNLYFEYVHSDRRLSFCVDSESGEVDEPLVCYAILTKAEGSEVRYLKTPRDILNILTEYGLEAKP